MTPPAPISRLLLSDRSWFIWCCPTRRKRFAVAGWPRVVRTISETTGRPFEAQKIPDLQHIASSPVSILCFQCIDRFHGGSDQLGDGLCLDRSIRLGKYRVDDPVYRRCCARSFFRCRDARVSERRVVVWQEFGFRSQALKQMTLLRGELNDLSRGRRPKLGKLPEANTNERHTHDDKDKRGKNEYAHRSALSERTRRRWQPAHCGMSSIIGRCQVPHCPGLDWESAAAGWPLP